MEDTIAELYFKYESTGGHQPGCKRGPDSWEVTRYIEYRMFPKDDEHEIQRTSLRLYCPECGKIEFFRVAGHIDRQFSDTDITGWGQAPIRMGNLWLWPGPELIRGYGLGPDAYYVTTDKIRPRDPGQVAGVIGQGRRSARANASVRFYASLGCTEYGRGKQPGPEDGFRTPTAAAKWIAGQLATRRDDLAEVLGGETGGTE